MSEIYQLDHAKPAVAPAREWPRFLSVKQVADYLHLNEKKVYALANEGSIPATRVTGKWLFPIELVDQWLINTSHSGLLTDRLVLAGSDDPLLSRAVSDLAAEMAASALVTYTGTGTRLGLELLSRQRADLCAIHWGPADEAHMRHPALLQHYPSHKQWVLVRAFRRQQGFILRPGLFADEVDPKALFSTGLRWCVRQQGAGSQRFLLDHLAALRMRLEDLPITAMADSERIAASHIARGTADIAPGACGAASEFGLDFVPMGWEAFDLALPRGVYFRTMFQHLLDHLTHSDIRTLADEFGGYDFSESGKLIWSVE